MLAWTEPKRVNKCSQHPSISVLTYGRWHSFSFVTCAMSQRLVLIEGRRLLEKLNSLHAQICTHVWRGPHALWHGPHALLIVRHLGFVSRRIQAIQGAFSELLLPACVSTERMVKWKYLHRCTSNRAYDLAFRAACMTK